MEQYEIWAGYLRAQIRPFVTAIVFISPHAHVDKCQLFPGMKSSLNNVGLHPSRHGWEDGRGGEGVRNRLGVEEREGEREGDDERERRRRLRRRA